jgi:hypothetical protein
MRTRLFLDGGDPEETRAVLKQIGKFSADWNALMR